MTMAETRAAGRLVTDVTHEQVPHSPSSFSLSLSLSLSLFLCCSLIAPSSFGPFGHPPLGILISTFDVMPNTYPYSSGISQERRRNGGFEANVEEGEDEREEAKRE